ncbi:MAG: hypothetical protein KGM43_07655, partial [Planctomycetota bacterium]|nr:hypothetical protein [Planctomycetota bacterium]
MSKTHADDSTPRTKEDRVIIAQIRGTPEFREWIAGAADHDRSSVTQFLERAAVAYAKQIGHDVPAPLRTGS